jgi:dolichol-phosphate mannosyltransferase
VISVVIPVYNEEESIGLFVNRTKQTLEEIGENYELIFALDPSSDQTEQILRNLSSTDKNLKIIKFSRRFGQPAATMAGLRYASGGKVVVIDADLQDPPELIVDLNTKIEEGFDVVYATRSTRKGENIVRKVVASLAYRIMGYLSPLAIPRNTGDFRMMNRRVVNVLIELNEKNAFLRGLVAYVGFKQAAVLYNRDPRYAGATKYNRLTGSMRIGLNGLIGFSSKPLSLMMFFGFITAFASFLVGLFYLISFIFGVQYSSGLPTLVILITFLSGVQIMSIGLVGEYISRIYDESMKRPIYIIDETINV